MQWMSGSLMSKGEKRTDKERLFWLREEKRKVQGRVLEINTWLRTAGCRTSKSKQDVAVRNQFIAEKLECEERIRFISEQIREMVKHIEVDEIRGLLNGSAVKTKSGRMVTDHALVRWLQRRHGIDVEEMRDALHKEALASLGGSVDLPEQGTGKGFRASDGNMVYVFDTATKSVVTCYQVGEDGTF